MEEYKLSVASSPHASSPIGTKHLMRDVLIALIPAMVMAIYVFGPRALVMTLISVVACEVFEWGYCALMHKPNPIGDFSAAITGAIHTPTMSPYFPASPEQISRQAVDAAKAGAAVVHIHARRDDGMPVGDFATFRRILSAIRRETDAVIGITTGGANGMSTEIGRASCRERV